MMAMTITLQLGPGLTSRLVGQSLRLWQVRERWRQRANLVGWVELKIILKEKHNTGGTDETFKAY